MQSVWNADSPTRRGAGGRFLLHGVRAAALWERSGKTRADTGACTQAADFWSVLEAAPPAENRDQRIRNAATLNAVEEPELLSGSGRACSSPVPTGLRLRISSDSIAH